MVFPREPLAVVGSGSICGWNLKSSNNMFLKEIETRPAEGMTKIAFNKLRDDGGAVPEILHLFRFKRRSTDHLVRFTEEVMRGPSPLSPGLRELIGAYF